jgi:hypothetical protein
MVARHGPEYALINVYSPHAKTANFSTEAQTFVRYAIVTVSGTASLLDLEL